MPRSKTTLKRAVARPVSDDERAAVGWCKGAKKPFSLSIGELVTLARRDFTTL